MDALKQSVESICAMVEQELREHEETMVEGEEPRDFMDMYINRIR